MDSESLGLESIDSESLESSAGMLRSEEISEGWPRVRVRVRVRVRIRARVRIRVRIRARIRARDRARVRSPGRSSPGT